MTIYKCDCSNGLDDACLEACRAASEAIANGKLIVYPTDTVYGIGASIYNESAVKSLFAAKKRPYDMALSVAVADKDQIGKIAVINRNAEKLIDAFFPGPLTIIIKKKPDVPHLVTACSDKVGIRIPDHPIAREIARLSGPIVATSANTHSNPDAVNIDMATDAFGDSVDVYVDAGPSTGGKPSTIVWIKDDEYEIIRQGDITAEMIEGVLNAD